MRTLIVIDMQNDFIDGPLGTKEAKAIVSKVNQKILLSQKYNLLYSNKHNLSKNVDNVNELLTKKIFNAIIMSKVKKERSKYYD